MKKVLLLLAQGFEVYEASVFIDVMGWNKAEGSKDTNLYTCAIRKNIESSFGLKVEVDFTIDEINPAEFDALALPGGFEEFGFYQDAYAPVFLSMIQEFHKQHKLISSICVGALALGKSGILAGKKATTYNQSGGKRHQQLKDLGVELINQPIVCEENITTSWSPVTATTVAFDLLEKLTTKKNMLYVKKLMGFEN